MKLIKKKHTYTTAEGLKKSVYRFYLVVEGVSKPIAIAPYSFGNKGNTYNALNLVAEYVNDNK